MRPFKTKLKSCKNVLTLKEIIQSITRCKIKLNKVLCEALSPRVKLLEKKVNGRDLSVEKGLWS